MKSCLTRVVLIGCLQVLLSIGVAQAADELITKIIRNKTEQIRSMQTLEIGDARIASITVLPELYANNGFQRLWTNPQNVIDLFSAVEEIDEDGLRPDDYHFAKIEQLRPRIGSGTSSDPEILAGFDILLTDSLIRLGYHLIFGKVDPSPFTPTGTLQLRSMTMSLLNSYRRPWMPVASPKKLKRSDRRVLFTADLNRHSRNIVP